MLQVPQVYEPRTNTIKATGEKPLRSYFEIQLLISQQLIYLGHLAYRDIQF